MTTFAQRLYGDNILMAPLGELRSRDEVLASLWRAPRKPPEDVDTWPAHARQHLLQQVRSLYIPSLAAARLHDSIDLALRSHYHGLVPHLPSTWRKLNEPLAVAPVADVPRAVFVSGQSGSGKTAAVLRCCRLYPNQVFVHPQFPGLVGSHYQVVWQSAVVPPTGRLKDLALELMRVWDATVTQALSPKHSRFSSTLNKKGHDAMSTMHEWKQVAASHFLGVLHLDEVQNFFRLPTLAQRRSAASKKGSTATDLSVAEDACLKYILDLANSGAFVLVLSGTPDGLGALTRRLSNAQRFVDSGYHHLELLDCESAVTSAFCEQLCKYQYVANKIAINSELLKVMHEHTAGIRRLMVALWICAHREAFDRGKDSLELRDFNSAAVTYFAPVRRAVEALRSGAPDRLRQYEDLLPSYHGFWDSIGIGASTVGGQTGNGS